ncbi:MAG: dTDP-4-dehydrorhamnose 3,5-epimerase [Alphaproteobacteria bacterium]|nr:MAG: dTDP-4-dehydrorhamnose 3,5-epimerase [Alphaproteobacteria bacterium]
MPFEFRELDLAGVYEIVPSRIADSRGFFSEVFNREAFRKRGVVADWVQDNHSFSARRNVLRGLHFQRPPFAQDKLVRVLRGAVLDVIVDIRHGSPTFAGWTSIVLSAREWNQVLVPKGFAHGMLTLEDETEVIIRVSAGFSRAHDGVIRYDDPAIGVDWLLDGATPILSDKDRKARPLGEQDTGFVYAAP